MNGVAGTVTEPEGGETARAVVWRPSLAIAFLGIVLTFVVVWGMWDAARDERAQRLAHQGEVLADSVDAALADVEERLRGIASFYRASEHVSAESFRIYTERLHPIPGLRGLGYIPIVTPQQLGEHEAEISETIPGYRVFEIDEDGNRVPVSPRLFHAPVQWFEPSDDPARPHGFDTASEPVRREAMRRAIEDAGVAVSGFIQLVDESPGESFLIYLPVTDPDSGRTVGFGVAPMELGELLDGQISQGLAIEIDWEIASVPRNTRPPEPSEETWATVMDVGNQWWLLTVTWDESGRSTSFDTNLVLVAMAGLAASLLAAMGFYQQRRKREAQRELEQLRSLTRAKDQFLASVSHELRTPLTGVLGFAELLRDDRSDLSDTERRAMISNVAEEATDLASIIDDLLVAARSELDLLAITRVPVALRAQAAQVVETFSDSIRSQVEIEVSTPKAALGDPGRVRQIIRNLLTNADRYGGERVAIRFGSDEDRVWLEVADNGDGIPAPERERIFEPYYRVDRSVTGQPTGIGIGLSVARHLARLMDGDLGYRRDQGWSVFTLVLPAADRVAEPMDSALQMATDGGSG